MKKTIFFLLILTTIIIKVSARVLVSEKAALQVTYSALDGLNLTSKTTNNWHDITINNNVVLPPLSDPLDDFVTTWKTDNSGTSSNTEITIPTFGTGYNYDVDWDNDGVFDEFGLTGDVTHDFGTPGIYTIRIKGDFPQIYFNNSDDKDKILSVDQWGNQQWRSMEKAFYSCSNFTIQASDIPDLSICTSLQYTFRDATSFNQNINDWDVSNIEIMAGTFNGANNFNQPLDNWNTSSATTFNRMFYEAEAFNQDISGWITSNITDMYSMFNKAFTFNQPIGNWDTSKVSTLAYMFREATNFNQNINNWDTGNVTSLSCTFYETSNFNQPLDHWDVSSVTNMLAMFSGATRFNQPLNSWDTSKVNSIRVMFYSASSFNQPLDNWILSGVIDVSMMFQGATAFNQDISSWDMSNVKYLNQMFREANSFDQDLSAWNIGNVINANQLFLNIRLSIANYDALLISWQAQPHQPDVSFSGGYSAYCQGKDARDALIADGWSISDRGLDANCVPTLNLNDFVTTWKTDNSGTSSNTEITIPTFGTGYNYDVDWDNDGVFDEFGLTGDVTHDFGTPGTYTIRIQGDFPQIYFNNSDDKDKILSVDQWGNQQWRSMDSAFYGCSNFIIQSNTIPDLSICTSLQYTFRDAINFNQNINDWDVSNIEIMAGTFNGANNFNQPLDNWNTSSATSFNFMFAGASSFNQDISAWDTSQVVNMYATFKYCTIFNQPLNTWNTANVNTMGEMFLNANVFNQPLDHWNTQNVTDMSLMFRNAYDFNQPIGNWNTSSVIKMNMMFYYANFNQNINSWDTGNVQYMTYMFAHNNQFNQPLGNWNTSQVVDISSMFYGTSIFNQDLSNWDTSNITDMRRTFGFSNFDQNLDTWNISSLTDASQMFDGVTLSTSNYDALLIGWQGQTHNNNIIFSGGNSKYCNGEPERTVLENDGWTITDGGLATQITPTFTQIQPICSGDTLNPLPTTSTNGINGVWSPVFNNTVTTTYQFTPDAGQCASTFDMEIIVNQSISPTFTQLNSVCEDYNPLSDLPTSSNDTPAITGTWTMTTDNTTNKIYTFTPDANQCANSTTMTINFDIKVTPTFTQLNSVCEDYNPLSDLPISSNDTPAITGTWTMTTDNTTNKIYTFTPDANQCANSTTMTINFDIKVTPTFTQLNSVCEDYNPLSDLPTSSDNTPAITGTWTMTTDNATNKTYTFTPDANQCANSTTMTINFDAKVTPTFTQVDAILAGDYLEELPTTSLEGILGTWSPTIDNTNTTVYTFIPDNGQCVSTTVTTMTIIVSPNIMCTQLIFPKNGQTDLPINTYLKWDRIQGATGYLINIGTQSGSTDIENNTDIGNSNMYSNITWKPNTTYYITIIAYNNFGEAIDCNETSFSTTFKIPRFFTPNGDGKNDYWIIEDDQKSIKSILIFNRFGKIISKISPSFSKWDGTYNGKLLKENDYWYLILLKNGNQLKGSITLKR